jgi:hypothetical protein
VNSIDNLFRYNKALTSELSWYQQASYDLQIFDIFDSGVCHECGKAVKQKQKVTSEITEAEGDITEAMTR